MQWRISAVVALAFGLPLAAQRIDAPPTPRPAAAAPAPAATPPTLPAQIVADVRLVNMVFSVEDKQGKFMPGLTQANFKVLEDGRPQTVQFFSVEDQTPLTLGLLLDTSGSQARVLDKEKQVSDAFLRQLVTPRDQAFVITFDSQITLQQDLTASLDKLTAAVDKAQIGSAGRGSGGYGGNGAGRRGGGTHLWDAIYLASHDELGKQTGRKAIVVVTDGGENGSDYSDTTALRAALDSNTIVYAVIAADTQGRGGGRFGGGRRGGRGGPDAEGLPKLEKLAATAGGRTFDTRGKDMSKAFTDLGQELRSQYTLAYHSDNQQYDGAFRTVQIQVVGVKDAVLRARNGYYAAANGQ